MSEPAKEAEELDALVGTTLAERYRIDELLGIGGMGAVFRAHHLLLKRDVAVKVLHPQLSNNEDISRRFDREAQSAARLEHPNIMAVTEFGSTEDGMKYMVMQLLSGDELGEHLLGPLDPMRAIELEIQILRGLEHAHSKGVIHRDLKPENVFVTADHDGEELLKLVDFGIAKIVDEADPEASQPLTRMGLVFGTPHYMSPEQATGSEVDHRTDIYSAGVILYQMLTGRPPFNHEDPVSLIRMQVSMDPPPLPPSVPQRLGRVVSLMMAKSRDQRYPDARAARKALQAIQVRLAEDAGIPVPVNSQDTQPVDPRDLYGDRPPTPSPSSGSGSGPAYDVGAGLDPAEASGPNVPVVAPTIPPTIPPTVPPVPAPGQSAAKSAPKKTMTLADSLTQSLPAVDARRSWLASVPRKWMIVGGGVLALVILLAVWPSGSDNEDGKAEDEAVVAGGGDEGDGDGGKPGVDSQTLVAIDQALTSKNDEEALDLIRPARDKYPEDPRLLWREGKALALQRAKSSKVSALERYGEALQYDPSLIDDPDFYGELNVLLREKHLQAQAIDLALQKLGEGGHKFLLELVNVDDPRKMLGWVDRHRILDELRTSPRSALLVDFKLNRARDLYQAGEAPKPCAAFRDTLDAIAKESDVYFVEHLANDKLAPPQPNPEDKEDAEVCAGLEDKIVVVRDLLMSAHPEEAEKHQSGGKKKRKRGKRG